jgi:hypothetical protein
VRRVTLISLALLLTVSGCAASQKTLAERLALERWNKCSHFDSISLDRIESTGMIWYRVVLDRFDPSGIAWTGAADESAAFQRCLLDALADQARGGKFSPSTVRSHEVPIDVE